MFPRSPFRWHPPPEGACRPRSRLPGSAWATRGAEQFADRHPPNHAAQNQAAHPERSCDRRSGFDRRRGPSNSPWFTALLSVFESAGGFAACPPPPGESPTDRFRFSAGWPILRPGRASCSADVSFGSFEPRVSKPDHTKNPTAPLRSAPVPFCTARACDRCVGTLSQSPE
jgi:hypothetical protein